MILLEQYLYTIRKHLSYSTRDDIIKELRSQLLDEIEATYGLEPTSQQIETAISNFGTPRQVANQYKTNKAVISPNYTDLYYFILKIVMLSLTLAFTVVMIIEIFTGEFEVDLIIDSLINLPIRLFSSFFQGITWVTLIFMIMTRYDDGKPVDLDENWTVKDLKSIEIDEKPVSKLEHTLSIFFISISLIVINIIPQLIQFAETSFETSGITLGHHIDLDAFKYILIFISILWIIRIAYHFISLIKGELTPLLKLANVLINAFNTGLLWFIVFYDKLYLDYRSLLGFKGVFLIIAIISSIELVIDSVKLRRK